MGNWTGTLAAGAGIFATGGTATGTIATGIGAGATSVIVNVTSGTCLFTATTSSGNPLSFATSPETVNIGSVNPNTTTGWPGNGVPLAGQQTLALVAGGTASIHNAGELVSETTGCAVSNTLLSPGTVVAAAAYSSGANLTIFPGEFNEIASNLWVTEPSGGFLVAGTTLTFTVATPGVVFSGPPTVSPTFGTSGTASGTLSSDRTAYTVTVGTADSTTGTITQIWKDKFRRWYLARGGP
jgi:hypothetical protein